MLNTMLTFFFTHDRITISLIM